MAYITNKFCHCHCNITIIILSLIVYIFTISDDPNEHNDISEQHPDIVKKLKARIEEYKKSYVHPQQPPIDPKSNPDHYGGFWTPGWC